MSFKKFPIVRTMTEGFKYEQTAVNACIVKDKDNDNDNGEDD